MKSFDELEDRFESIPELSVSEESLGAFIEGNLDPIESSFIAQEISKNELLEELYYSACQSDDDPWAESQEEQPWGIDWDQEIDCVLEPEDIEGVEYVPYNDGIDIDEGIIDEGNIEVELDVVMDNNMEPDCFFAEDDISPVDDDSLDLGDGDDFDDGMDQGDMDDF